MCIRDSLCDPLIKRKHPFSILASSIANKTVHVAKGLMGQYCPSWCQGVAWPLIAGFAKKLEFHKAKSEPKICSI